MTFFLLQTILTVKWTPFCVSCLAKRRIRMTKLLEMWAHGAPTSLLCRLSRWGAHKNYSSIIRLSTFLHLFINIMESALKSGKKNQFGINAEYRLHNTQIMMKVVPDSVKKCFDQIPSCGVFWQTTVFGRGSFSVLVYWGPAAIFAAILEKTLHNWNSEPKLEITLNPRHQKVRV